MPRKSRTESHQRAKQEYYERGSRHRGNSMGRWSKAERDAIMDPKRPSDHTLAERLERTVSSIQAQRGRIKGKKRREEN